MELRSGFRAYLSPRRRHRVRSKRKRLSRSSSRRSRCGSNSKPRSLRSSATIRINRAPLLILWAAVVAQMEGYSFREGLTFGKAIAMIFGHAKGRAIGRFQGGKRRGGAVTLDWPGELKYKVMNLKIPARMVNGEVHAVKSGKEISPKNVHDYLKRSFGPDLKNVKAALRRVAKRYSRREIGRLAYALYEKFRPKVPEGLKGWGAKGKLDIGALRSCKL